MMHGYRRQKGVSMARELYGFYWGILRASPKIGVNRGYMGICRVWVPIVGMIVYWGL